MTLLELKMDKVFPSNYEQLHDFLIQEDIEEQVESLIAQLKEKYIEQCCDDSFEYIAHDGIWNTIAGVVEIIAQENQ
jgi:hypothetical protein